MNDSKQKLNDVIEMWARSTGVSQKFVDSVISLFKSKGISLDDDATPYLEAVVRAFQTRAETEKTYAALNTSLSELQDGLNLLRDNCLQLVERSQELEQRMHRLKAAWERAASAGKKKEEREPTGWMLTPNLLAN